MLKFSFYKFSPNLFNGRIDDDKALTLSKQ